MFAVGAFVISNAGTAAMGWLSQLAVTPTQSAAVSTGIGLAVVFLTVVLDSFKEPKAAPAAVRGGTVYTGRAAAPSYQPSSYQSPPPYQQQPYQPPAPAPRQPMPKSQRRISWLVVLIVVLGVCGIGGFAATWGVQWLNGQAICLLDPKHYDGVERLAGAAAATSDQLGIEITQVTASKCGTIITVHAVNAGDLPLELPVFGNTSLTVPGRTSLGGDPRTSDWNQTVPARGEMTGVLVFKAIPNNVSKVRLSFNTVFGLGRTGPGGIAVDIPLTTITES